jgi:hypothetical protein
MAELNPARVRRTVQILYLALLVSLAMYAFIAYQVTQQATAVSEVAPLFVYALVAVALAVSTTIPLLRRAMLPSMKAATSLGEAAPAQGPDSRAAVARYQTAQIVSWALAESIAIDGLILTFISHDLRYYLGFVAAALANFALYRPRADDVESILRAAAPNPADPLR